jgi:predicted kinase
MSLRISTRLRTVKEDRKLLSDSSSSPSLSPSPSPKSKRKRKTASRSKTIVVSEEPKQRDITIQPPKSRVKSEIKAASERNSSSSEKVLTPPIPEITMEMLQKKPWLSQEFLFSVMEELKSPSTESKENPKMLALVGPMGAGKSTVKRQLDFDDAVNLDVDEVKIIAVREFGQKAKGSFADFGKIIQLLSVMIINNKYDFILDTTGRMKQQIKYVMKNAKNAGYRIDIAIVYSTQELCESRAHTRNTSYRARDPVPTFVVTKTYNEFKDSKLAKSYILGIKDIVDMTDNLYLFDNSRCTPEAALIMERHGKDITVHEDFPDFYGVSVNQLSPKLVAHGIKKTRKQRKNHRHRNIRKTRRQ